jgi:flagellar hook-basal body complex protein FliE
MHISAISSLSMPDLGSAARPAGGSGFADALTGAIQAVEQSQSNATKSVEGFLSGDGGELHSTILATERAQLEFDMFLQVRNKIVSAYQEIMQMQM